MTAAQIIESVAGRYAVKGSTRDITTCEHCGRTNLKKTVILVPVDIEGAPEGDPVHFGVSCAATALRVTETRIHNAADSANAETAKQVRWAQDFIAVYGPVEGNIRATAEVFFTRNPRSRGEVKASVWVGEHLAKARTILVHAAA